MHNIIKKLFTIFFGMAFFGCATNANYEKFLNSWVGANEKDLIKALGTPNDQYKSSSTKFLTYQKTYTIEVPGTAPTYSNPDGNPAFNVQTFCKTTFEVKDEYILNWQWEGNGCKAKE